MNKSSLLIIGILSTVLVLALFIKKEFISSIFLRKGNLENELSLFEERIQMQKDQLFGISLYFRMIESMYSEQPEIIQMNRQSFENIRKKTEDSITAAGSLLLEVKRDPSKAKKLKRFKFPPTTGRPMLDQMTVRVEIILQTYEHLFPGRSKSQPLGQEELMQLMMEASNSVVYDDVPITPFDMILRMKDIPEILQWSKKKHLVVSGPSFWGVHHIFIDENLCHVIICLKDDRTSHVFIGNESNAKKWRKYDKHYDLLFEQNLDDGVLEWKIYKDIVLYKGKMLPPKEISAEPYYGALIDYEEFTEEISDSMIVRHIRDLFN